VVQVLNEQFGQEPGSWCIQQRGALRRKPGMPASREPGIGWTLIRSRSATLQ